MPVIKAPHRAKLLWDYYNEYGRICIEDVNRLTGSRCNYVYKSFEKSGMTGPPVWDSHIEIAKRKIAMLTKAMIEMGQNCLTMQQIATLLEIKPSAVDVTINQFTRYDLDMPTIVDDLDTESHVDDIIKYTITRIDEDYYPSGLQVLDSYPEDDKTVYRLR